MSRVAVVTGLGLEAAIARRGGAPAAASGAVPDQAAALAAHFIRQGACGLVSFGVAGGVAPGLRSGALVLAETVVEGQVCWRADPAWLERAASQLPAARRGTLAASQMIVGSPEAKRDLARIGALAVDMESGAVARAAADAGLPFLVVRAVADRAGDEIPEAAALALQPAGAGWAFLGALVRRPGVLVPLAALGWRTGRALYALERSVRALGPDFALP